MKKRTTVLMTLLPALMAMVVLPQAASAEGFTAELNGIEMYYEIVGEGEPVVLLHGFLESGQMFASFVPELSARYKLIIPDLRGHGGSTNPSGEFTMQQSTDDILALMDHLGIERFKALGHSAGAVTLLGVATKAPERVEAVVLIGSGMYYTTPCRETLAGVSPEGYSEQAWARLRQIHRHGDEQIASLIGLFASFAHDYDDVAFTPPLLATVQAKVLLVQGDRDYCFPAGMAVEMYEAIPNAYLCILPNAGHWPVNAAVMPALMQAVLSFFGGQWN
jgi:pimeloyl-ACP methyl ester carboxylesterase